MSDWFSISLGDGITASEPLADIEAQFALARQAAGMPPDMAVFVSHESEGRLHCTVRAYFSPACVTLAQALAAQPCPAPNPVNLTLLAGDKAAWASLFPGRGR